MWNGKIAGQAQKKKKSEYRIGDGIEKDRSMLVIEVRLHETHLCNGFRRPALQVWACSGRAMETEGTFRIHCNCQYRRKRKEMRRLWLEQTRGLCKPINVEQNNYNPACTSWIQTKELPVLAKGIPNDRHCQSIMVGNQGRVAAEHWRYDTRKKMGLTHHFIDTQGGALHDWAPLKLFFSDGLIWSGVIFFSFSLEVVDAFLISASHLVKNRIMPARTTLHSFFSLSSPKSVLPNEPK